MAVLEETCALSSLAANTINPPVANSNAGPQTYEIYNYFRQGDGTVQYPDAKSWKDKISRLTNGKMITNFSLYTTPLKVLGPLGKFARKVSLQPLYQQLSRDHGVYHEFIVFDLKDISDEEAPVCSVSIEKRRSGLVYQIAAQHETVKYQFLGSRRKHVKLHGTNNERGFEGLFVHNLAIFEQVLKSVEVSAFYHWFMSNCQQTASDWQQGLVDKSMQLKFLAPGGSIRLSLNDDSAVDRLMTLHSDWEQGIVQRFPDVSTPFVRGNPSCLEDILQHGPRDYSLMFKKQQILEALCHILQAEDPVGGQIPGQKAVSSNLTSRKFARSLELTRQLPSAISNQLAQLWNATFDITLVLEGVGVVIVQFQRSVEDDVTENLKNALNLAAEICPPEKNLRRFFILNFCLDQPRNQVNDLKKLDGGYVLHAKLSRGALQADFKLRIVMRGCMSKILAKSSREVRCNGLSLDKFAARLYLLQNLETDRAVLEFETFCSSTIRDIVSRRGPSTICYLQNWSEPEDVRMWRLRSTIGDCDVAHVFDPSQLIGCQFFSVILISSLDVHAAENRDPSYQLGLSIMRRATDFISIIFHRFPEPLATAGMQRHAAVDNDLLSIAEINDCIAVVPFSP